MKKKIFAVICIISILSTLAFAGCAKKTTVLVTYLASNDSVEETATIISKASGADLFKITPKEAYTSAQLEFADEEKRIETEQKKTDTRVELSSQPDNIGRYETIYIGYPIWYDKAPRAILTFIESCELEGKNVVPFAISPNGDIITTTDELKKAAPKANWLEGVRFSDKIDHNTIVAWADFITNETDSKKK